MSLDDGKLSSNKNGQWSDKGREFPLTDPKTTYGVGSIRWHWGSSDSKQMSGKIYNTSTVLAKVCSCAHSNYGQRITTIKQCMTTGHAKHGNNNLCAMDWWKWHRGSRRLTPTFVQRHLQLRLVALFSPLLFIVLFFAHRQRQLQLQFLFAGRRRSKRLQLGLETSPSTTLPQVTSQLQSINQSNKFLEWPKYLKHS